MCIVYLVWAHSTTDRGVYYMDTVCATRKSAEHWISKQNPSNQWTYRIAKTKVYNHESKEKIMPLNQIMSDKSITNAEQIEKARQQNYSDQAILQEQMRIRIHHALKHYGDVSRNYIVDTLSFRVARVAFNFMKDSKQ